MDATNGSPAVHAAGIMLNRRRFQEKNGNTNEKNPGGWSGVGKLRR